MGVQYRLVPTQPVPYSILWLLGALLLAAAAPASARPSWATDAPCNPYCTAPSAPTTSGPSYDLDGNYTVSTTDWSGTTTYGWVVFQVGGAMNATSGTTVNLSVTNKPTGTHTHRAKACIGNNGGELCSAYGPAATVYVVKAPANPTIDATTAVCGPLNVTWSPGSTGYPTPTHEKRYDLQESINGGAYADVSGRVNTTATSWSRSSVSDNAVYSYRVRAFYVWNGYTSEKTGWISDSLTQPVCPPTPGTPALSQPVITGTDVYLSWSAPPSGGYTLNYPLERRDVTASPAWTQVYAGTATSYNDTGTKTRGNTYEYRVRACNNVPICGAWSSTVIFDLYQVVDLGYEYDALGRLIRVGEGGAVKAGYCYDKAGNRYHVSMGSGGGENCPPPPASLTPTNLSAVWQQGPSWYISWSSVQNAVNYQLRLDNSTTQTVTSTSYTSYGSGGGSPPEPEWVRACFADSSCGPMAYF